MTWELRWHPFRGQWVLFTSHRDARPWIGEMAGPLEPPIPDDNALAPLGCIQQQGAILIQAGPGGPILAAARV